MNRNLERGSATRERLLTIAEELFVEHGFDGTSTETILREAGVSRARCITTSGTRTPCSGASWNGSTTTLGHIKQAMTFPTESGRLPPIRSTCSPTCCSARSNEVALVLAHDPADERTRAGMRAVDELFRRLFGPAADPPAAQPVPTRTPAAR